MLLDIFLLQMRDNHLAGLAQNFHAQPEAELLHSLALALWARLGRLRNVGVPTHVRWNARRCGRWLHALCTPLVPTPDVGAGILVVLAVVGCEAAAKLRHEHPGRACP